MCVGTVPDSCVSRLASSGSIERPAGSEYPFLHDEHIVLLNHVFQLCLIFLTATVNANTFIAAHRGRSACLGNRMANGHVRTHRIRKSTRLNPSQQWASRMHVSASKKT